MNTTADIVRDLEGQFAREIEGGMLPVNEIFETIQGEATYAGTPATFIRLQGCPVGCPWCDTKHTWELNPHDKSVSSYLGNDSANAKEWFMLSALDIRDRTDWKRTKHAVITGGEPCMYDLVQLTNLLRRIGVKPQVETSGTFPVRVAPGTYVTCSPKFGMNRDLPVRDDVLKMADELKMVVGKPEDITEFRERLAYVHHTDNIWLQPVSISPKATKIAIEAALTFGYKVSLQAHKYAGIR